MRVWLLIVLAALFGCRGADPRSAPATKPAGDPWAARADVDPWAVTPNLDAPPDLAERQRLANEACPKVIAPYFYRIEKAGKVSHILGTRHIGVPLAKFPRAVHDALASATLVVFEVAPDDETETSQASVSIRDELGPALWKRYQTLVGADLARSLERTTPAAALLSLMVMYEDIGSMLDLEIQRKVIAAGIATGGLESSAFQDDLLERALDIRMLRASVEHTDDRKELASESRKDLAEYCAGTDEVPGMDEDMRKDLLASGYTRAELDRMDDEMVHARNADWIPKLEPMLDAGNVFIAVGADHLTGKRGVIALLAARGYTTSRVK